MIDVLGDRVTLTPLFNFLEKGNLPFIYEEDCIDPEFKYCAIDPDGKGYETIRVANGKDLSLEFYR
jgi:hypothetical protein